MVPWLLIRREDLRATQRIATPNPPPPPGIPPPSQLVDASSFSPVSFPRPKLRDRPGSSGVPPDPRADLGPRTEPSPRIQLVPVECISECWTPCCYSGTQNGPPVAWHFRGKIKVGGSVVPLAPFAPTEGRGECGRAR